MSKEQRNLRAGDSAEATGASKPRRDIANDAAAHALRLLEKVRSASEARLAKSESADQAQKPLAPHAVVIGGGIAGLVAARELRQTGHEVTVLEATANFGGCVRTTEVAGMEIDAGAESFALRGGIVSSY
ncbi:MAG: FAD-dependent oxidoreductase, partial [Glutamicibacter sp.]